MSAESAQNTMPNPTVLPLSNPALIAALGDVALLQQWEALRRTETSMSASEFAAALGLRVADAQRSLDRLIAAGLVTALRATRARRHISYRAVSSRVIISWNPDSPAQRKAVAEWTLGCRRESRAILDRHFGFEKPSEPPRPCFYGYASFMVTIEEIDKVNRAMRVVTEVLDAADLRSEERARGSYSGAIPAESERPYHLALEWRPLAYPEPPCPALEMWDDRSVPREVERNTQSAQSLLSAREFEIAKRLAAGQTRPIIAKALGITHNTVATVCKRIHAKLGVHRRAELTARLRDA